jgi:CheY-like chemotaxis protein
VAAWAVGRLVSQNELEKVDASLNGVVRVAGDELSDRIANVQLHANETAHHSAVREAFADSNAAALARFAQTHARVRFLDAGRSIPAPPTGPVVERDAVVRPNGRVFAWRELDRKLVAELAEDARVPADGGLVIARRGSVVAGSTGVGEPLSLDVGDATDATLGGTEYRALASRVGKRGGVTVVALASRDSVESASRDAWWNALWAVLATLATVGLLAYAVAPAAAWRWERRRRRRAGDDELGPLELEGLAAPGGEAGATTAPAPARPPRRVLLIDDDPAERALITEALDAADVRVTAIAEAERALEALDAEPTRLAILDWEISGRSGAEILAELNIRHPDVRVLVITDELEAQQRHVATLLGAEDFLVRPLTREAVSEKITHALADAAYLPA